MNGLPTSSVRTTPGASGVASGMTPSTAIELRRSGDRFWTQVGWLDSRHSFSFGPHYDPANTHFGLLMVSNEDVVAAGAGFDTHPHRDMEIVTWGLSGGLVHADSSRHPRGVHPRGGPRPSAGSGGRHSGVIHPGVAQRLSAGSGILHSEKSDTARDVHFVQMWVVPDTEKITPEYDQLDIGTALESGELLVVASGMPRHRHESAISIRQ